MPSHNSVTLVGHATRDAVLRFTPSNVSVLEFGIAVNSYRGKDKPEEVYFGDVVVFGKLAEKIADRITKGVVVTVVGRLKTEKWKAKDGNDRSSTRIVADLAWPGERISPAAGPKQAEFSESAEAPTGDDIPF